MKALPSATLSLLLLAATPALAAPQDPCEGNGIGSAYVDCTAARVDGELVINIGSPGLSGGIGTLNLSKGLALIPTGHPDLGTICLDILSPSFSILARVLDGSGNHQFVFTVPNDPSLVNNKGPFYANALAVEVGGLSLSKTVRINWETTDGYNDALGAMAAGRGAHTATALGSGPQDNRIQVIVAGGGGGDLLDVVSTATTELYDPLTRSFSAGPPLNAERGYHAAVRLDDGRVLFSGGAATGGAASASCEVYDHDAGTLTFTGSMNVPRLAHPATLLANGKVLVTGGLADYVDANNNFLAVLNSAQSTAELFDPVTNSWSFVPGVLSSKRSGHTQTLLADGRVLIIGGVSGAAQSQFGGEIPLYTNTCDIYDPVSNSLISTGAMLTPRGFHGASLLANGDVLVTGGSISDPIFGSVLATAACEVFDGALWAASGSLPTAVAFHTQIPTDDGEALLQGGFVGSFPNFSTTAQAGRHDGTGFTTLQDVGLNLGIAGFTSKPRGQHTATRLYDGMILLIGGTDLTTPFSSSFAYLE